MRGGRPAGHPRNRIILVAHDVGGAGGMERQLSQLVAGIVKAGRLVTVVARTCTVPPSPQLTFVRVPGPARPVSLAYPWFAVWASVWLRLHRRSAIVHTTGALVLQDVDAITVHLSHRAIARRTDVRRSRRTSAAYRLNALITAVLGRAGEWWCYRPERVRALVAVSRGLARELQHHHPRLSDRLRVIANGVDITTFRPDAARRSAFRKAVGLSDDDLVALFVGNEWEGKGLTFAISALQQAPDWHLVVVGTGDEPRYRRASTTSGVSGRTHFLGALADTGPAYSAADAFILPSAYETFSLATFEAAASGLPLLVPRLSGVEEVLSDEDTGWFIKRDAEDIARRLRELGDNADLRRRMGMQARANAAAFDWEAMVHKYLAMYDELSAASSPRGQLVAPG